MVATSATGGYLVPSTPAPIADLCLDVVLQRLVAGITGLRPDNVRPRWTPDDEREGVSVGTAPRIPDVGTNWAAVEVMNTHSDASPALLHDGTGEGSSTLRRFDTLECLVSFFGPDGEGLALMFRDGLAVRQNREAMTAHGLGLVDTGDVRRAPSLVNTNRSRRYDLDFRLTHRVERTYPIRNVLEAEGVVHAAGSSSDGPVARAVPFRVDPDTPHTP